MASVGLVVTIIYQFLSIYEVLMLNILWLQLLQSKNLLLLSGLCRLCGKNDWQSWSGCTAGDSGVDTFEVERQRDP